MCRCIESAAHDVRLKSFEVNGGANGNANGSGLQFNEEKLIRDGQRGDSQAVEALFRRYHRPLFQTALRVLGNAEDAEDALQDGMLSAYRNLKRFEGRSQFPPG